MKQTMKKVMAAALGAALALALTGCGAATGGGSAAAEPAETIAVSASGVVMLTPDKASVTFGVSTQEASAALAQRENGEAVAAVIATLTARGVEEKSIRTVNYALYPMIDYSDDERSIIGYRVQTTLCVQDQEIDGLGELLSACVEAGVNDVDGVSFFCSDYDEAYRQALAKAVEAARQKAETLAAASGRKLGEVMSVVEGWENSSARYNSVTAAYDTVEKSLSAPSFQAGETEINAYVTVVFRMK